MPRTTSKKTATKTRKDIATNVPATKTRRDIASNVPKNKKGKDIASNVPTPQQPPKPDHTILIPEKLRSILLDLGDQERTLTMQLQSVRQQRDAAFQAFLLGKGIDDPANVNIGKDLRAIIVWDKKPTDDVQPDSQ